MAVITGYLFVKAQSVADDFSTTDYVADTWQTTVATTTGQVTLEELTCDNDLWHCSGNDICANVLDGSGYIVVHRTNAGASSTYVWKTAQSNCDQPQCGIDGGQTDNLVADNTINFNGYSARDACKALGGRLPTKSELSCIYTNKETFGNNFVAAHYWSSTEYATLYAWRQSFSDGAQLNSIKDSTYYVRCVRGW